MKACLRKGCRWATSISPHSGNVHAEYVFIFSFHVGGINRSFVLYSGRVQRSKGFEEKRFHSCSFSFSLSAHSQIQLWWGISRFSSHAGLFPGSGRHFPNPADSADGAFIADQHSVECAGWRTHILWYNGRLFSLFVMPLLCSYLYDLF